MRLSAVLVPLLSVAFALGSPISDGGVVDLEKRAVSSDVFDNLRFYFQYASSAYNDACAKPNGNTLVLAINNVLSDTQGFIARDDTRKEIVVSLRGSESLIDALNDALIVLIPFLSPGVFAPLGTTVHTGFLTSWNSVALQVIATVGAQLALHPDYTIITTGHSLGGALSSLAGISLKQNFPSSKLRLYTYGQPRTGNAVYAQFVNNAVGLNNIFRATHTTDGVPTIIPRGLTFLGYLHHATEYWQSPDPASAATTKRCDASGEDPTCSASIPSMGINDAHGLYFNIRSGTAFCT
ncbi:alpha/beta-hydrolase [Lyophyllum atratum]|nr:alpha/beta-hydrolase [Lyophyllum atratum]